MILDYNPLMKNGPDSRAIFPPRLLGSAQYYSALARFGHVEIDHTIRYDKRQKRTHRFDIADAGGKLSLTVPVSRPQGAFLEGNLKWADITVSAHGRWWEIMPVALESAYGRTPFFEFYIDRLMPLFEPRPLAETEFLHTLSAEADSIVRKILGIETQVRHITENQPLLGTDLRNCDFEAMFPIEPYWQVRQHQLGFLPDMSVLDLIFNLGPEAPLKLR